MLKVGDTVIVTVGRSAASKEWVGCTGTVLNVYPYFGEYVAEVRMVSSSWRERVESFWTNELVVVTQSKEAKFIMKSKRVEWSRV